MFEEDKENIIQHYIEIGAVEISGIDESGEFIFTITPLAQEVAPDLWYAHQENVENILLNLFEKGLLNISYDEDLNAHIELTEEGKFIAKQNGIIEEE
jgi:hypothetical protein